MINKLLVVIFMTLEETIDNDSKTALKERREIKVSTLRMLKSALKNRQIELKKEELTDQEAIAIIHKELKKRKDAIESYQTASRQDLVDKEKQEADILSVYLPAMMSEDEIKAIVDEIVSQGADNFGQVMKGVMAKTAGQAEGQIVQRLVKEKLQS